jgi:hypothetical protein
MTDLDLKLILPTSEGRNLLSRTYLLHYLADKLNSAASCRATASGLNGHGCEALQLLFRGVTD